MSSAVPQPPPPPATRSLEVVLREALDQGEFVKLIVAKALADGGAGFNPNAYLNVEIEGLQLRVPKLAGAGLGGSGSGYPVYVLITKDFMLAVGTVQGSAGAEVPGAIPIGGILQWPNSAAPANWLACNGASFSSATYPQLANVLGSTTLPDLRRRVVVGMGTGGYSIGNGDGQAESARGIAHHHHMSMVTSVVGDHSHPAVGDHQHSSMGGQFFAETGLGLTGAAGTARYVVANGYSQTAAAGGHQHGAAGQHQHGIDGDTSGGGAQDAPSWTVLNFIIRAL